MTNPIQDHPAPAAANNRPWTARLPVPCFCPAQKGFSEPEPATPHKRQ
jgi:hypothetical protein